MSNLTGYLYKSYEYLKEFLSDIKEAAASEAEDYGEFGFTRGYTHGEKGGLKASVTFFNKKTGLRRMIVGFGGGICHFPGIENKAEIEGYIDDQRLLSPVVRYRSDFEQYDDDHGMMIWQVQPDGSYYSDDDGFGSEDSIAVKLYALIDRNGRFTGPFRAYRIGDEKFDIK